MYVTIHTYPDATMVENSLNNYEKYENNRSARFENEPFVKIRYFENLLVFKERIQKFS